MESMNDCGFKEVELKLKVPDENTLGKILQDYHILKLCRHGPRINHYETTYYDTEKRQLMKRRVAYRIRQLGGEYVATLKGYGYLKNGLAIRDEWNKTLDSNRPTLKPFADLPIGKELIEVIGKAELLPLFSTRFKRITLDLTCEDGSIVEMAADQGEIIAGSNRDRICEIELELKSGLIENVIKLGQMLIERYDLKIEQKSKYLRGLILAGLK